MPCGRLAPTRCPRPAAGSRLLAGAPMMAFWILAWNRGVTVESSPSTNRTILGMPGAGGRRAGSDVGPTNVIKARHQPMAVGTP